MAKRHEVRTQLSCTGRRSQMTSGGERVPNPIAGRASPVDTERNEVNPTHRQPRKGVATREQSKAMVEGAEEEAKSERRPVMGRIGHA